MSPPQPEPGRSSWSVRAGCRNPRSQPSQGSSWAHFALRWPWRGNLIGSTLRNGFGTIKIIFYLLNFGGNKMFLKSDNIKWTHRSNQQKLAWFGIIRIEIKFYLYIPESQITVGLRGLVSLLPSDPPTSGRRTWRTWDKALSSWDGRTRHRFLLNSLAYYV